MKIIIAGFLYCFVQVALGGDELGRGVNGIVRRVGDKAVKSGGENVRHERMVHDSLKKIKKAHGHDLSLINLMEIGNANLPPNWEEREHVDPDSGSISRSYLNTETGETRDKLPYGGKTEIVFPLLGNDLSKVHDFYKHAFKLRCLLVKELDYPFLNYEEIIRVCQQFQEGKVHHWEDALSFMKERNALVEEAVAASLGLDVWKGLENVLMACFPKNDPTEFEVEFPAGDQTYLGFSVGEDTDGAGAKVWIVDDFPNWDYDSSSEGDEEPVLTAAQAHGVEKGDIVVQIGESDDFTQCLPDDLVIHQFLGRTVRIGDEDVEIRICGGDKICQRDGMELYKTKNVSVKVTFKRDAVYPAAWYSLVDYKYFTDIMTMRKKPKGRDVIPQRHVARILGQMCRSVQQLHRTGWFYNDAKPANFMTQVGDDVFGEGEYTVTFSNTELRELAFETQDDGTITVADPVPRVAGAVGVRVGSQIKRVGDSEVHGMDRKAIVDLLRSEVLKRIESHEISDIAMKLFKSEVDNMTHQEMVEILESQGMCHEEIKRLLESSGTVTFATTFGKILMVDLGSATHMSDPYKGTVRSPRYESLDCNSMKGKPYTYSDDYEALCYVAFELIRMELFTNGTRGSNPNICKNLWNDKNAFVQLLKRRKNIQDKDKTWRYAYPRNTPIKIEESVWLKDNHEERGKVIKLDRDQVTISCLDEKGRREEKVHHIGALETFSSIHPKYVDEKIRNFHKGIEPKFGILDFFEQCVDKKINPDTVGPWIARFEEFAKAS